MASEQNDFGNVSGICKAGVDTGHAEFLSLQYTIHRRVGIAHRFNLQHVETFRSAGAEEMETNWL